MNNSIVNCANVNDKNSDGDTPIILAAIAGDVVQVGILIAAEADINCRDKFGNSPLILAAQANNLAVLHLLVLNGADESFTTESGETAEDIALSGGAAGNFFLALRIKRSINDLLK